MKKIFILLVISMLLAACNATDQNTPSDPKTVIETQAGKEFKLLLDANPSTGYHWEIVGSVDSAVVEFVSRDYKSTSDPNLVGGGGVEIWVFKATGAGEASITLGYYPPSNTPTDPVKTETFTVSVK